MQNCPNYLCSWPAPSRSVPKVRQNPHCLYYYPVFYAPLPERMGYSKYLKRGRVKTNSWKENRLIQNTWKKNRLIHNTWKENALIQRAVERTASQNLYSQGTAIIMMMVTIQTCDNKWDTLESSTISSELVVISTMLINAQVFYG